MISNKINGFPGFLMGAPGALEISRRREIALWSKFARSDGLPGGLFGSVELVLIEKSPYKCMVYDRPEGLVSAP